MITALRDFWVKISTGFMKAVKTFATSFFEKPRAICVVLVILLSHFDEFSHNKITPTEQPKFEVMS